ncbi:MAG: HD domain-containing protein [Phycisphaerales bacterium]|nr:HD domain-containing protein [Phycisphaerales bacterium]
MTPEPRWQQAASLAARAHATQTRKDGCTPYIAHPMRVALTVATRFGCADDHVLCVALLHDVIEDTTLDYDDVAGAVGAAIADDVASLTKDMRLPEAEREAAYDAGLASASWAARLVKLADVYDNLHDAWSSESRQRAINKARRAIGLAAGEPRLDAARALVEALLDRTVGT